MTRPTLDEILETARRRADALSVDRRELESTAARAAPLVPLRLPADGSVGVIAEIKRRSPSAGSIRAELDAVTQARAYAAGGAAAISVLTDEVYFGGSIADLEETVRAVPLPVLRKDFIVDEVQLLQARAAGASLVLLIVCALEPVALRALGSAARTLGLGTLVEVHSEVELEIALSVEPTAIGVNSRDLRTYAVDLGVARRLVPRVPAGVLAVAESGVERRADVERLAEAGADFVLVGTAVARSADPREAVRVLVGVSREGRG